MQTTSPLLMKPMLSGLSCVESRGTGFGQLTLRGRGFVLRLIMPQAAQNAGHPRPHPQANRAAVVPLRWLAIYDCLAFDMMVVDIAVHDAIDVSELLPRV